MGKWAQQRKRGSSSVVVETEPPLIYDAPTLAVTPDGETQILLVTDGSALVPTDGSVSFEIWSDDNVGGPFTLQSTDTFDINPDNAVSITTSFFFEVRFVLTADSTPLSPFSDVQPAP